MSASQIIKKIFKKCKIQQIFVSPARGKWKLVYFQLSFLFGRGFFGLLWKEKWKSEQIKAHKQVLPNTFAK